MPYWADLWPASRMLAKAILHEPWTPGTEALEIGCGLGLPGIVALSMGLKVTFSDYDACALRFAADNARLNGCDEFPHAATRLAGSAGRSQSAGDLGRRPDLRDCATSPRWSRSSSKVLAPGGLCLLTDVDRMPSPCVQAKHCKKRACPIHDENDAGGRTGRPPAQGDALSHHRPAMISWRFASDSGRIRWSPRARGASKAVPCLLRAGYPRCGRNQS